MHHLHEDKKVLHRDIKPNNVFLMDSKKIVQLGDFGLAKVINDGDKQVKAEVGPRFRTLAHLPKCCVLVRPRPVVGQKNSGRRRSKSSQICIKSSYLRPFDYCAS